MSNVNLPVPVALAAGGLCLLGGYLVGVVAGPDPSGRSTAEVTSFDASDDRLCLAGDAVADVAGADEGELCGTWRHSNAARDPRPGDAFRFVTMTSQGDGSEEKVTFIYGDVVPE